MNQFQAFTVKSLLKRWKGLLDCIRELMETINQICLNTAESKARDYRALLTNHKTLFCVCFMTDILSIMDTLTLFLQKEGAPLVDIPI